MTTQPHTVVVVSAIGGSLGAGLSAALDARGWIAVRRHFSESPIVEKTRMLLVVEDHDRLSPDVVRVRDPAACVCVSSVHSLPLLIRLAERGSPVLNPAVPFLVLLRLVEEALLVPNPASTSTTRSVARLRRRVAEMEVLNRLTAPEAEVLEALMEGWPAGEIAARTHRSLHTVRSHIKAVLSKLGVTSQIAATAMAERSGLYLSVDRERGKFTNCGDDAVNALHHDDR